MRSLRQLLLSITALVACALSLPSAHAQRAPLDHSKVIVGVIANIRSAAPYTLQLYSSSSGETDPISTTTFSNQAGLSTGVFSPGLTAQLLPNRIYRLAISSTSWSWADVAFNVPAGYTVKLGPQYDKRVARSTMRTPDNNGGSATYTMDVEIQPADGAGYLRPGFSTMPTLGEVKWSISLGQTPAGLSAGAIRWRQPDINQALLDPISLEYADPLQTGVSVGRSGPRLAWIQTWALYLEVQPYSPLGTGYKIVVKEPWTNTLVRDYKISNPDSTWQGRVKIEVTTYDPGGNFTDTWILSQTSTGQSFEQSNGQRKIKTDSVVSGGTRTETITIEAAAAPGVAVAKTQRVYQTFAWGREELVQEVADPDGLALTTVYTYFDPTSYPIGSGSYARLQSLQRPDGSWERYEYYDDAPRWGRLKAIYKPWQDAAPLAPASATSSNCAYTEFDYAGERDVYCEYVSRQETKILGTTTSKVTTAYTFNTNSPWVSSPDVQGGVVYQPVRVETQSVWTSATQSLTTVRKYFHVTAHEAYAGKQFLQENPDGTKVITRHNVYVSNRLADALEGSASGSTAGWNSYDQNAYGSFSTVQGASAETVQHIDYAGRLSEQDSGAYPSPSAARYCSYSSTTGELIQKRSGAGGSTITDWSKTRTDAKTWSETDKSGVITDYFLDQFQRLQRKEVRGVSAVNTWGHAFAAQPTVVTTYTYDAADRAIGTTMSASSLSLTTSTAYNLAGLPTSQTDERGLTTTVSYADGGATITTTLPGGAQKVDRHYKDGTAKSTDGSAVVRIFKKVTCNVDGTLTIETQAGSGTDRWQRVTTDWAGRTIKEEKPAPPGVTPSTVTKTYFYNTSGQLVKTTEPGVADTLYSTDPVHKIGYQALDLTQNGSIDLASTDRVTRSETTYNGIYAVATGFGYATDNNATSFTAGSSWSPLLPQNVTDWSNPQRTILSHKYDVWGNDFRQEVTVDPPNRLLVTKTLRPDANGDSDITYQRNGLTEWQYAAVGYLYFQFKFDALRRPTEAIDPRTGSSKTGYYTSYTGANGQVAWKEDASGARTNYYYSSVDGRLSQTIDPQGNSTYYAYNSRGDVIRQWGAGTYPAEYEYNDYGEKVKMRTFRDPSTDFTQATFPYTYPSSGGDTTTWAYDSATGVLLTKTDAVGRSTDYTYNVRGQLMTRQWARHIDAANNASARVTATYGYDPLTAEQTSITYNDGTPGLVYTYNRLGQLSKVEQWLTSNGSQKRTTLFDRALSGAVTKETLDASFFGERVLTNVLDPSYLIGRKIGYKLGTASDASAEGNASYWFWDGRVTSIIEKNLTFGAQYSYVSNAQNLIDTVKTGAADPDAFWYVSSDSDTTLHRSFTYEDHRNYATTVRTEYGQFGPGPDDDPDDFSPTIRTIAKLTYQIDSLGRRTSAVHEGEVMADYTEPSFHLFTYNARSELTADASFMGSTVTDQTRPLSGRRFEFAYDNIGNRQWSNQTGVTALRDDYTTNALNQYVTRENNTVPMSGTYTAGTTIAVTYGSTSAARQGKFWADQLVVPNSTSAWNGTLSVTSTPSGGSPSVIQTKQVGVPAANESMTYDLDGNILQDGCWVYTWDAENRLIQIETRDIAYNAGIPHQRLKFTYDYLGRRIQKTVESWSGSAYTLTTGRKFIYDGWNIIAEYDALSGFNLLRSYLWGLDISRSLSDAGGVGGLLLIHDWPTGKEYQPAYDGNGNVLGLLRRSDATVAASYEYSPSGEFLRLQVNDSTIADQPFRFSTKFYDAETNFYDYGHRYYSPSQGRFLGRDPIEEKGGLHLYAFCLNNAVNMWDVLGNWGTNQDVVSYSFYTGDNSMQALWDADDWQFYWDLRTADGVASTYDYQSGWFNLLNADRNETKPMGELIAQIQTAADEEAANRAAQRGGSSSGGVSGFLARLGSALGLNNVPAGTVIVGDIVNLGTPANGSGSNNDNGSSVTSFILNHPGPTAGVAGRMAGRDTIVQTQINLIGGRLVGGALGRLGRLVNRILAASKEAGLVDQSVIAELQASGVKITPQNVVATGRNAAGQTVFLETGNSSSGLIHIIEAHGADFGRIGVAETEIPSVVTRAVTEGEFVGYQGGRPIYQITINGQAQNIAVTVGDNGYIVGANPAGTP